MILKKYSNDYNSFDIDFIQDGKILSIYQTGADINFSCKYEDYRSLSSISFQISSDQEEVYPLFHKLYTNIITGNVMGEDPSLQRVQESMQSETSMSWYQSIIQDGVITIYCDAYPMDCPNVLKIMKQEDGIILTFDKVEGDMLKMPYCIPINIRQSGSRIYDFSIPFKTLFMELQAVEEKEEAPKSLLKKEL